MPLEEVLQIVTLALLVCVSFFGAACIAYVFRFRWRIIHGYGGGGASLRHLRDFNSPWILRVLLSTWGIVWILLELLRLPILRNKGWALHKVGFNTQVQLCRSYVLSSLGFAEPVFFLTALFLLRESLCSDPFSFTKRRWRFKAVSFIAALNAPVLLVQLFFAFITPAIQGNDASREGFNRAIPKSFTLAYLEQSRNRTDASTGLTSPTPSPTTSTTTTTLSAACRIPLLSTVAMSFFGVLYVVYFLYLGWRMLLLVINRRLQVRVYGLLLAIVVLVPVHLLLLGLSSSALVRRSTYEIIAFVRVLMTVACISIGQWMLVIRPISDAMKVLDTSLRRGGSMKVGRLNSWGAIPVDQFSLPLSATLSVDEDRSSLITELSVELTSKDGVDVVISQ